MHPFFFENSMDQKPADQDSHCFHETCESMVLNPILPPGLHLREGNSKLILSFLYHNTQFLSA